MLWVGRVPDHEPSRSLDRDVVTYAGDHVVAGVGEGGDDQPARSASGSEYGDAPGPWSRTARHVS